MLYWKNIRSGVARLADLEFFEWFMIFSASTALLIVERYFAVEFNVFLRLFFCVLSVSLLCFWISWILFGFKAVKARAYIFAAVFIACAVALFL